MKTLNVPIKGLTKVQYLELKGYCHHSNSLYNCCLYTIKNHYKDTSKYIGFKKLYHEIKSNEHYVALPSKIGNQILKVVDQSYRSFFALLRAKKKGLINNSVSEPRYRKSGDFYILPMCNQQFTINKGKLKITKSIKLPFNYKLSGRVKMATVKPYVGGKFFKISIVYENEPETQIETKPDRIISIDLGLNNLVSCYSNVGRDIIVNGKPLKAYNQLYNKQKAKMKSELEIKNKKKYSQKLRKLDYNLSNFMKNFIDQSVNFIKKEVISQKISKVIIGYNEGWKNGINIGKKNNQNFTAIPHFALKEKLKNKLEGIGVEVIFHEESYTSKCSALDMEPIKKHEKYLGRRVKRGLFRSSNGLLINADLNGAINIMRKVIPDEDLVFSKGIERCIVHPKMLNLFNS